METTSDQRKQSLNTAAFISDCLPIGLGFAFIISLINFSYGLYLMCIIQCITLVSMYVYRELLPINPKRSPLAWHWPVLMTSGGMVMYSFYLQKLFNGPRIPDGSWSNVFYLGAICGLPILMLTVFCARQLPKAGLYTFMPFLIISDLLFGAGIGMKLDIAFDQSKPVLYQPAVIGHKEEPKSLQLLLSPWGPVTQQNYVGVPWSLYREEEGRGSTVCISFHPGALGVPWYILKANKCESEP